MNYIKILRIMLIVFGAAGVIWFLLPFFIKGICNIGNVTGIVVFLCFLLYGIYLQQVNQFVTMLLRLTVGKGIIVLFSVIACVIIFLTILASTDMVMSANRKVPNESMTVIVLGCKVNGERPSLMLEERLKAAYSYLSTHSNAPCIVSGGIGEDENISEAECMYHYLVERGIDSKRIFLEDQSTSTRENLLYSKKIIDNNQLPNKLAIVTNEFHEYRASKIASKLGLQSSSISARTAWWLFPTYYVRELYGIVYEWVF